MWSNELISADNAWMKIAGTGNPAAPSLIPPLPEHPLLLAQDRGWGWLAAGAGDSFKGSPLGLRVQLSNLAVPGSVLEGEL